MSNQDFNADKVQQHEQARERTARIYEHQPSYFGPGSLNSDISSDELKIQKDLMKKGYQRVHKKIKGLRQNFQNFLAGRRKISDQYYEDLLQIWGGSPCVEALPFGASTSDINPNKQVQVVVLVVTIRQLVSSCSEDNTGIFNASSVRLLQLHGSIINSTDNVDDYSASDDSDNKNEAIIKKSIKKDKLVILLLLLVKIQYQN